MTVLHDRINRGPFPCGDIQLARGDRLLVRARIDHAAVRQHVHERVIRNGKASGSQYRKLIGGRIKYFREIGETREAGLTTRGDQHPAIRQSGCGGVPAAIGHVWNRRPCLRNRIEDVRVLRAERRRIVSTNRQNPSICELRKSGTEEVVVGVGNQGQGSRNRIPHAFDP